MKPPASVVIPDSHELRPAITCNLLEDGSLNLEECMLDYDRVTIDLGYLRSIMDLLDACRKAKV